MGSRIVVGVDGSLESIAALRWAVREAALRGATIEVVTTWSMPQAAYVRGADVLLPAQFATDLERDAKARQAYALEQAVPEGEVPLRTRVVEGHPAEVLVDAADGAELLVIGSRGIGGFREMLLGSVSHQCAQHATCPVVIIRGPDAQH